MKCCQERSAQIMEYAEGSLPSAQTADLERHLSSCVCCRQELASWRGLEERLRAFPLVAEPANFKLAVMSRIAETRSAPVPVAYRPVDPVMVGALGAVLLGVAALLAGAGGAGTWELSFSADYWLDLAHQLLASMGNVALEGMRLILNGVAESLYRDVAAAAPVLLTALLLALFALGPRELASALNLQSRES